MQPFRFLDLPQELQRSVLTKYFEDEWVVETKVACSTSWPPTSTRTCGFVPTTTCITPPVLLVCRQLLPEARNAMLNSLNVLHRGQLHPRLQYFAIKPLCFGAITKVEMSYNELGAFACQLSSPALESWADVISVKQYQSVPLAIKDFFPRLHTIEIRITRMTDGGYLWSDARIDEVLLNENVRVLDLLTGAKDNEIEEATDLAAKAVNWVNHWEAIINHSAESQHEARAKADDPAIEVCWNTTIGGTRKGSWKDPCFLPGWRAETRKCGDLRDSEMFMQLRSSQAGTKIVGRCLTMHKDDTESMSIQEAIRLLEPRMRKKSYKPGKSLRYRMIFDRRYTAVCASMAELATARPVPIATIS